MKEKRKKGINRRGGCHIIYMEHSNQDINPPNGQDVWQRGFSFPPKMLVRLLHQLEFVSQRQWRCCRLPGRPPATAYAVTYMCVYP